LNNSAWMVAAMSDNNQHHPCGPSSLRRRELCPGSLRMESGLPETTSPAAERGTNLHKACELYFQDREAFEALDISEDDTEQVLWAIEKAKELIGPVAGQMETRLENELFSGTADVLACNPAGAIVIDYKFGRVPVVEACRNIQLAAYAWATHKEFGHANVTAAVIQPALRQVTSHEFTRFDAVEAYLRRVITAANAPEAPLRPSEEACRYCKAYSECPAVREQSLAIVARVEKTVPISTMETVEIARLVEMTSQVIKFHELAKAALLERLSAGDTVPGWRVKPGANRREADASELFGVARDYLTAEEFAAACKVSIPSVETAIAQKVKGEGTLKAAKELAKRIMEPAVTTKSGNPQLERAR
jgi:hypothetical protein